MSNALVEFKSKADLVLQQANALVIFEAEDYKEVEAFAQDCQDMIKQIDAKKEEIYRPLKNQIDEISSQAKELKAPFEEAKRIAQGVCVAFMKDQEEKRRIAEAKAREEAEAERKRLLAEAEAERKRLEAEAKEANEQAKNSDSFEDRIEAEAKAKEVEIQAKTKAIEVESQIAQVAPVVPIVHVPKSSAAISVKTKWVATVDNMAVFVKYVADHSELLLSLKLDMPALNKYVNATNGQVKIPGVSFRKEETIRTSSRRTKKNDALPA